MHSLSQVLQSRFWKKGAVGECEPLCIKRKMIFDKVGLCVLFFESSRICRNDWYASASFFRYLINLKGFSFIIITRGGAGRSAPQSGHANVELLTESKHFLSKVTALGGDWIGWFFTLLPKKASEECIRFVKTSLRMSLSATFGLLWRFTSRRRRSCEDGNEVAKFKLLFRVASMTQTFTKNQSKKCSQPSIWCFNVFPSLQSWAGATRTWNDLQASKMWTLHHRKPNTWETSRW